MLLAGMTYSGVLQSTSVYSQSELYATKEHSSKPVLFRDLPAPPLVRVSAKRYYATVKLRTYILLILLLFALTPMALLLTFGLPPMLERLQVFYQQAHLQQLRADFRDLDQHMASRQALTGVVAKLPEPGILVSTDNADTQKAGEARSRYTEWINRLFGKSLDIISINFLDENGTARFWLVRDETGKLLKKTATRPDMPSHAFLTSVLNAGSSARSALNMMTISVDSCASISPAQSGITRVKRRRWLSSPLIPADWLAPIGTPCG